VFWILILLFWYAGVDALSNELIIYPEFLMGGLFNGFFSFSFLTYRWLFKNSWTSFSIFWTCISFYSPWEFIFSIDYLVTTCDVNLENMVGGCGVSLFLLIDILIPIGYCCGWSSLFILFREALFFFNYYSALDLSSIPSFISSTFLPSFSASYSFRYLII
jgi:hypothetical protein